MPSALALCGSNKFADAHLSVIVGGSDSFFCPTAVGGLSSPATPALLESTRTCSRTYVGWHCGPLGS